MFRLFGKEKPKENLKPVGTLAVLVVVLLLGLMTVLPTSVSAAVSFDWDQTVSNAFSGDVVEAMISFGGDLHVASSGGQDRVWVSSDGATWTGASAVNFSDIDVVGVHSLLSSGGYLYAGTCNDTNGAQLWRTQAVGGPPYTDWVQVEGGGFGDVVNQCIYSLSEFDGNIYAATGNGAGSEIWRSNDGTSWTAVVATGEPGVSHNNGFGDGDNDEIYSMLEFGGYIYASTDNNIAGGEVWRSSDGANWTAVVASGGGAAHNNGFGDSSNVNVFRLIEFDNYIYAGAINNVSGLELWRSSNGTSWSAVVATGEASAQYSNGFGDSNSTGIYSTHEYRDELFVGTYNINSGTEVWKSSDGTTWSQVNDNGFGVTPNPNVNASITAMELIGDTLYLGVRNASTSSEIRVENPPEDNYITGVQSTNGDGEVTVTFEIDDAEDASTVQARVEYDIGDGWEKATLTSTDSETTATTGDPKIDNSNDLQVGTSAGYIDTSSGANTITTIWESQTDEPAADTSSARLRVFSSDQIIAGDAAQSTTFDLDNVSPTASANPVGGSYSSAQSVTLTASESPATIYYTTSGSNPTTSSTVYSSAITIGALGTTDLKFLAVDDKGNQSPIYTETYTITSAAANITLTKTTTSSSSPAKVASADNHQITAASSLLSKAGGFLAGNGKGKHQGLRTRLLEINLILLISFLFVMLAIWQIFRLRGKQLRPVIRRLVFVLALLIGISSLASLSTLTSIKETTAATGDVNPGDYITYRLDYSNTGGSDAQDVYILDAVPSYSTYVPGTLDLNGAAKTDAQDSDEADFGVTNSGKATFKVGKVTVGSSGYVSFKVRVNDNAPMGAVISNTGNGAYNPGNNSFQSNTVQNTVIATGLISGYVFYDANNNGTRDSGDFGISGASVKLYEDVDQNGSLDTSKDILIHTKSSSSTGSYEFTGLSANYYLIYVDGVKSSYKLTTGNVPGQAVLSTSTQQYTGANFGYYAQPTLPKTPPIIGGKKDDDTITNPKLPVDKTTDTSVVVKYDTKQDEQEDEKEDEKEKRPDKLEDTIDLKLSKEKTIPLITRNPLVTNKIVPWLDKFQKMNKNYVAPIILFLSLINFLFGVPFSVLLSYLHYLLQVFTEPLLYFGKKKRREWGVVYNSLTRQPIDLAMIRLFDQKTNRLVETRVTDQEGRFLFIVEPEKKYYIAVDKPHYTFPSKYLMSQKSNAGHDSIYHGQLISEDTDREMKETGHIAVDIPLDPKEGYVFDQSSPHRPVRTSIRNLQDTVTLPEENVEREDRRVRSAARWRRFNQTVGYIGPMLGLISFIISPTLLTFTFLVVHIILLILFNRLALGRLGRPWGKVFNVDKKKSLSKAVVRLFDSKYGRLLLTTVSKSDGRYGFLVGENMYSLVPFKEGYKYPQQKATIIGKKERVVKKDLGMKEG